MKIVIAIDSFKGCLTSAEANHAAAEGVRLCLPDAEIVELPVSDGGEGWLVPFVDRLDWQSAECQVSDPLKRPIHAHYAQNGDAAAIEIAQACGLTLLTTDERQPLVATTYGVGEMIAHAVGHGARNFVVGLGGSATSDAGMGMIEALRDKGVLDVSEQLRFTIATDVQNPLCGPQGAAHVFAAQKGATPIMIRQLDLRAQQFADASAKRHGYDCSQRPGAGAAGGLGYAFMQFLGAECLPGADLLMDMLDFDALAMQADLVITGEGRADRQTTMGKLPFAVLKRIERVYRQNTHGKLAPPPTLLLAGHIDDRDLLLDVGFCDALCINPPQLPTAIAMQKDVATSNIRQAVASYLATQT